jgi:hypothetical protein
MTGGKRFSQLESAAASILKLDSAASSGRATQGPCLLSASFFFRVGPSMMIKSRFGLILYRKKEEEQIHAQHNQWRNAGQSKEETKVRQEPNTKPSDTQKEGAVYRDATRLRVVPFLFFVRT